jgi:hypothetical protein
VQAAIGKVNVIGWEELYFGLVGYEPVQSGRWVPTFPKNILLPEYGKIMILRNVSTTC